MNVLKLLYRRYRQLIRRIHSNYQLRGSVKGTNNNVFGNIEVVEACNLKMGNDCSFNHGCYLNASNGIELGDDVTLSAKSCVVSTGIDYISWMKGKKQHTKTGKVRVGNHVWIGTNATILPGVTISGEYVVIAANAVVAHDIQESNCIYAGVPAKKIRNMDY